MIGALYRSSGFRGRNRHEHATRHEPFRRRHFDDHRHFILADASAVEARCSGCSRCLVLILFATLALGALVMGTISVVSLGFAAVLLGLAVDYAVVHYQEALAHPQMTVPEIRRAIAPSILWAAITTISAFLVLNLGGLPGLGQLGSLVAIGIAVSALVMVMIYLPPLFPEPPETAPEPTAVSLVELFRRAAGIRCRATLRRQKNLSPTALLVDHV